MSGGEELERDFSEEVRRSGIADGIRSRKPKSREFIPPECLSEKPDITDGLGQAGTSAFFKAD